MHYINGFLGSVHKPGDEDKAGKIESIASPKQQGHPSIQAVDPGIDHKSLSIKIETVKMLQFECMLGLSSPCCSVHQTIRVLFNTSPLILLPQLWTTAISRQPLESLYSIFFYRNIPVKVEGLIRKLIMNPPKNAGAKHREPAMAGNNNRQKKSSSFFSIFSIFKACCSPGWDKTGDEARHYQAITCHGHQDTSRWAADPDIDNKVSTFIDRIKRGRQNDAD